MLAVAGFADEEEKSVCHADEIRDSKGKCCIDDLMDEEEGERKCFEQPSQMSVAVAFTLIGSFTFLISLNFAMNWPDDDIKKYAYKVISSTVSIFSAVLMFQCINGLVEDWIMEPYKITGWKEFIVDSVHMMIWYTITQFVIALAAGAFKSDRERETLLDASIANRDTMEDTKENVEVGCCCYGGVLAHLTGFASINAWTTLQQQKPFHSTVIMALLPLPIAAITQMLLQKFTGMCRERVTLAGDGKKDWFEERWDKACDEAEDDVMGLTLSVILVNAVRMFINGTIPEGKGCLPNQEQKEEGEMCEEFVEEKDRTFAQVLLLFGAGTVFVISLFIAKLIHERLFPEGEEEESDGEEDEKETADKGCLHQASERYTEILMITLSMAFSWCIFHANRQLLTVVNPGFLGDEKNDCTLAVVLALEVTYIAFFIIWVLDAIADLPDEWTPPAVDASIKVVIDAISLFIGFAWEQTFDVSVDSLANSFRPIWGPHAPATAKFIIGSLCCSVVFLAWKWYILPFVVKEGWKFHYVFTGSDLHRAAHKVAEKDKDFKEWVLPVLSANEYNARHGEAHGYTELPGEEKFTLEAKKQLEAKVQEAEAERDKNLQEKQQLLQDLQKAEADKEKLEQLVHNYMQTVITSMKDMHQEETRVYRSNSPIHATFST